MDFNPESTENDNEESWIFSGRDGHVILVDSSQKMFHDKKFHEAMEIIEAMMKNLIIKNEKNLVSGQLFIIFFSNL